jgi:hypothetical protein
MAMLETEIGLKGNGVEPEDVDVSSKTKFGVFGEEMIEKEVKLSGNTGRIYLPLDWVGKHVKIIRMD